MLITKSVVYRGKEIPVTSLKPNSQKRVLVKCDQCGKIFEQLWFQHIANGHELCQHCAIINSHKKPIPIGTKFGRLTVIGESQKNGYSVCRCECGTVVEKYNTYLRNGSVRSCGCLRRDAASDHAKKYLSKYCYGKANWNYKGGSSKDRPYTENRLEYRRFKEAVKNRDGCACRKCGSVEQIEIHHIYGYSEHPELAIDPDNGICLCNKCHRQFHRIYGKYGVGKKEIDDFLR